MKSSVASPFSCVYAFVFVFVLESARCGSPTCPTCFTTDDPTTAQPQTHVTPMQHTHIDIHYLCIYIYITIKDEAFYISVIGCCCCFGRFLSSPQHHTLLGWYTRRVFGSVGFGSTTCVWFFSYFCM